MTAFELRKLVVSGEGVEDAEVSFSAGLNVIVGPSDTGKTYIFQCLDYMLGAGTPPKEIEEDKGYSLVSLTIATEEGREYELRRALAGGDFVRAEPGRDDVAIGAKHSARKDNISTFLLDLVGLQGKRVRRNNRGVTRSLSFRDLAHLAFVDEGSVMGERSPILTGPYEKRTEERRVFNLLMSGDDDSAVIAAEKPELFRAQNKGRAEILEALIESAESTRPERDSATDLGEAEDRLTASEAAAEAAQQALSSREQDARIVEDRRREAWSELRIRQSKADVLDQLKARFVLLQHQYEADLERLAAVSEAALRIDQMPVERCSICGALPEHQDHIHGSEILDADAVRASCEVERAKIANLIGDLQETADKNSEDLEVLRAEVSEKRATLESFDLEMSETLRPKLVAASEKFREAQSRVRIDADLVRAFKDEARLKELLTHQPRKQELPEFEPAGASAADAADFVKAVEEQLSRWHFPDIGEVSFSEEDQDIVIGSRRRRSYGQGKRAITHASFTLGLQRFCINAGRPSSPLVMIDSPLVVFREPDPSETVPMAVKDHFYRSIADGFADTQVLIFENEVPPSDVFKSCNVIRFTGTESGRRGFLHGSVDGGFDIA